MYYIITVCLVLLVIIILMYLWNIRLKKEVGKLTEKIESNKEKLKEVTVDVQNEDNTRDIKSQVDLYKERSYVGDYGEVKVEKWLVEILNELKKKELIKRYDVLNNIVFTDTYGVFKVQLDHVVLTDKGIFLIETKAWSGDIYFESSVDELIEKLPEFYFSKLDLLKLFDEKYSVVAQIKDYSQTETEYKKLIQTDTRVVRNCSNFKYQVQQQATYLLEDYFKEDTESMMLWINGIVLFCNDNVRYLGDKTEEVYAIKNIRKSKLTLKVCTGKFELETHLRDKIKRINVYISNERFNDLYEYLKKYEIEKSESDEKND